MVPGGGVGRCFLPAELRWTRGSVGLVAGVGGGIVGEFVLLLLLLVGGLR